MESPVSDWEDPQCPFRVEWAPDKLNKVRIAVVDAFYAVPRGGIEIGGLLLGRLAGKTLYIDDFAPVECEHLTGPSFALSDKDESALAAQLAALSAPALGWYHSHTRSELALSAKDAELHDRFFSKPFQIAMVLRPSNSQSTRANYFFRSRGGAMLGGKEHFDLQALKTKPTPITELAPVRPPPVTLAPPPSEPRPQTVPQPEPEPVFLALPPIPPRGRGLLWTALSLLLLVGLAAGAFATKDRWLPKEQQPLKLRASDLDGKLIIRWDPVREATSGELHIADGGKNTDVTLDATELRDGMYAYARQSASETVRLKIGQREETTSFAGPLSLPLPKEQ